MATNPLFERNKTQLEKWRAYYNLLRGLTANRVVELLEQADRGNYGDVMWLLRKVEKRNETVRACKARMLSEVSKLRWDIKSLPEDEWPAGVTQAMVDAQANWLKQRYKLVKNIREAIKFLALADLRGFSHLEKHYDDAGAVCKLEPVPQWHWLRLGIYGDWKYNPTTSNMLDAGIEIDPVNWIIREQDDAWFEIALSRAFRASMGDKDFDGFVEDYAIPWFFLIGPQSSTPERMKEFQDVADAVVSDGRGVLPFGSDVKGPPGNPAANADVFDRYLKHQEERIVLAATGGLLTMLTAPGSGTLAGSAHQEAWENLVAGVAMDIEETMQEQFDAIELQVKFPGQPVLARFNLAFPEVAMKPNEAADAIAKVNAAGYKVRPEIVEEATGYELEDSVAPEPIQNPKSKIKNRFSGGAGAANDQIEAMQLAENALAEVLQVGGDYLAPIRPDLERLIALASDPGATLEDFTSAAADIAATFPELMDALPVSDLTDALEKALGPAAVMGARGAIRQTAKNRQKKGAKP